MIVYDIASKEINGAVELSAAVRAETARKEEFRIWFRMENWDRLLPITGDPFLASFLIPCMYVGESLRIEAPVSQKLLDSAANIQALISRWYKDFNPVNLECPQTHHGIADSHRSSRTGVCFSLGVDSWYSTLKHRDAITDCILIQGFDIRASETQLWNKTFASASHAANVMGKRLIVASSNMRRCIDMSKPTCKWGKPYPGVFWRPTHGSFLAATALCLEDQLQQMIIPSSLTMDEMVPFGSHPELDPLWSTDDLQIIHDGCEGTRQEKIEWRVAKEPLALQTLRVCLEHPADGMNCCRCEKCIRTLISLRLSKVIDQATSFPKGLDLRRVRRIHIPPGGAYPDIYRKAMQLARKIGDNELADAIDVALGNRFSLDHLWARTRQFLGMTILHYAPYSQRQRLKKLIGPLSKRPILEKE